MKTRQLLLGASIAAVFVLAACGDDNNSSGGNETTTVVQDTTAGTGGETSAEPTIVIKNFAFTVNDAAAGTITVRNDDTTAHTVTADDGSFDVRVEPGETATFEVTAPGTYAFHCKIHSTMKGSLVVS